MNVRRFIMVLSALTIGFIVYHFYVRGVGQQRQQQAGATSQPAQQQQQQATQPGSAPSSHPSTQSGATASQPASQPAVQAGASGKAGRNEWAANVLQIEPSQPIRLGSLDPASGYLIEAELVNRGAAIRHARLTDYFCTVADSRLARKDPSGYAKALKEDEQKPWSARKYLGQYSVLNPIEQNGRTSLPMETRSVKISLASGAEQDKDSKAWADLPLTRAVWNVSQDKQPEGAAEFYLDLLRDVNFNKPDASPKFVPYLRLFKTYTLARKDYSINVALRVENLLTEENLRALRDNDGRPTLSDDEVGELLASSRAITVEIDQAGPAGLWSDDLRTESRAAVAGRYKADSDNASVIPLKEIVEKLKKSEPGQPVEIAKTDEKDPGVWVGISSKYFMSALYLDPGQEARKSRLAVDYPASFYFRAPNDGRQDDPGTLASGVKIGAKTIKPGSAEQFTVSMDLFVGPKKRSLFSDGDAPPARSLYGRLAYRDTIDTGSCFCAWGQLTWAMMWLLEKLSIVSLGNYGVAIIVLVILVRVALHPLTKKGQVSMMKMQKLGPAIQKIKEKYKDDKEALNREMMSVYKQAGATPILGCLPMFLQMPIWIALWTALSGAIELRHAAFLPVWITDLSAPDAVVSFGSGLVLPLLGPIHGLNLLPILVTVAMFLQTKMNPQMGQAGAQSSEAAAKQAKMMAYLMPAMMLFLFYPAPSGLNLYIMTSTFAGVAEQWVIKKHIKAREEAQAAIETTVDAPGKAARGVRPKKPKGPMWTKNG